MLTPINVLNADPADLAPDMPANTGHGRGANGFQARLGAAMDAPPAADGPVPAVAIGEELPPGGNELPIGPQLAVAAPISRTLVDEWSVIALEGLQDAEVADPQALAIESRIGEADVELSIAGYPYGSGPGQVVDVLPTARIRAYADTSARAAQLAALEAGPGRMMAERQALEGLDPVARGVALDRLAADSNETARQIAGLASGQVGAVAEKIEGLQRKLHGIGSQPAPLAVDAPTALTGTAPAARLATAAPIQAAIDLPVLDDAWGEALNERVLWMAGKSIQKAEIRLNPADMGPIRVEVSIVDDNARVSFSAQHAVTRDAIEAALPRLREMLGENGISLTDTDVSDAGAQQGQHAGENDALPGTPGDGAAPDEHADTVTGRVPLRASAGLVDTFV